MAGPTSFNQVSVGAPITGLTINLAQTQLYAATSAVASGVEVFNSAFTPISLGATAFATPANISALGLVTFNVQDIGGNVYVTYAPAGRTAQTQATGGQGAVAVFTEAGALVTTYLNNELAAPWGVTIAPALGSLWRRPAGGEFQLQGK